MGEEESPLRDTTGDLCGVNQQGDVWYLGGAKGGGKISRTCKIPANKVIFLPLITTLFFDGGNCQDRVDSAAASSDHLDYANFELDGVALPNASRHRQKSPGCFPLITISSSTQSRVGRIAATDGYWVMLRPLPPGEHILKFKAAFNKPGEYFGQMKQDVQYRITVLAP